MKLRTLGLVALVATLGLASCKKEDVKVDQQPKAVAIDLMNVIAATKTADGAVADKSAVVVNNLQVFFSDGNKLYEGKTIDGGNLEHYFASYGAYTDSDADETTTPDAVSNDRIFHLLDAAVNKVIVVANYDSKITAATETALNDLLNPKYIVEEQQDDSKLDLYGFATLTTVSGEDRNGHPIYKAKVVLEPRVSRMEVAGFKYKELTQDRIDELQVAGENVIGLKLGRKYKSIKVEQVVFNGWYQTASAADATAANWSKNTNDITASGVFKYFSDQEANTNDKTNWANEMLNGAEGNVGVVDLATSTWSWTPAATTTLRPVYNFFPKGNEVTNTQLVIKLTATNEDDTKVALYLATKGFTPALTQDLAKVYTVNFEFDDADLENPQKCVEVEVAVTAWDVVSVTPEF